MNDQRKQLPGMWGFGITVDNVNDALPRGLMLVKEHGVNYESRGMLMREVPGPVMTIYRTPQRRVLFDPVRDANPFFHLMEAMWILAGSDHVHLPRYFLKSIVNYSDDGMTFHGAYGHRLRHYRGELTYEGRFEEPYNADLDQLAKVVELLRDKPDTRQAVLSIWDPERDLGAATKDMPCNDMVMFNIRDGYLHMTVCNRSNDVILGAYGANAVQFSVLQEWVAAMVGADVGFYTQQSNSFHIYPDSPHWQNYLKGTIGSGDVYNPYMEADMDYFPLATTQDEAMLVQKDAERLDSLAILGQKLVSTEYESPFFRGVINPMITAYDRYLGGDYLGAHASMRYCDARDWRLTCEQWLGRRQEAAGRRAQLAKDIEGGAA
jgi:hypothetical protein